MKINWKLILILVAVGTVILIGIGKFVPIPGQQSSQRSSIAAMSTYASAIRNVNLDVQKDFRGFGDHASTANAVILYRYCNDIFHSLADSSSMLRNLRPDGFDKTGEAVFSWSADSAGFFHSAAEAINSGSVNNVADAQGSAERVASEYAMVLADFASELNATGFSESEKKGVMMRLVSESIPPVAREKQRLSRAGAYKVVEQWTWCGDGIGQRAIVLTGNPKDLEPAFHRFLDSSNGDRSKCIWFEVFTDRATLDQSKSVSENYPDSELVHQWSHELQYVNNPNSGLEEWDFGIKTLSDGTHDFVQHVVHAGK